MNENQRKGAATILREAIRAVEAGEVVWFAVGYKTVKGTTLKCRSEKAPKRIAMPE